MDHVEELRPLRLNLSLRSAGTDHFFQRIELVLREVRALRGNTAAHGTLEAILLVDAIVDIVDGILRALGVARLVDLVDLIHLDANAVVNLLPCLRGIRGDCRQEQEQSR